MTEPAMPKAVFLRQVLETENALIHINPRPSHVIVPKHLKNDAHVVLLFGWRLPVPIHDMQIEDALGISGTLSFNRAPFRVFLPWDAVFGIVGDNTTQFLLWPDAFTEELFAKMAKEDMAAVRKDTPPPSAPRTSKRPNPAGLRLVKNK